MRLYYFMEEEHLDEYDKIAETEDNPLGLEPNAKATPIAIRDYYQFLIINNKQSVGMVEYKIENSEIDNKEILYLKNIYIKKEFRGQGLGKEILNELEKLNHRIELECWYGMPANNFYKSFGFKELKTRYMIDSK